MIRKLIAFALVFTAVGLIPSQASAIPSADTEVDVLSASQGSCSNGSAVWQITADITISNTTEEDDVVIATVDYEAKYQLPDVPGTATTPATVIDDGGLVPGVTIGPGDEQTFTVVVEVSVPCAAIEASLFIDYTIEDRDKTYTGSDFFLTEATQVPAGAIGSVGLAVLAGAGLVLANRRSKRSVSAAS